MKRTFMDSKVDPSVGEASLVTNEDVYMATINVCDWKVLSNVTSQNFGDFDCEIDR